MRWPKYSSFSFSIIPSKEIPGLISFRIDWLDLLAVQGTLKSLLQHHSSRASILQRYQCICIHIHTFNMSANLENSAVATGLEKVSFHYNPKEGQCQRMYKLPAPLKLHCGEPRLSYLLWVLDLFSLHWYIPTV